MEFSSLAPRPEPAPQSGNIVSTKPNDVLGTVAETARPVLAPTKADATNPTAAERFQPLDTFEVGDNDHVPVPPEPPRKATVLALMAEATEALKAAEAAEESDAPEGVEAKAAEAETTPEPPRAEPPRAEAPRAEAPRAEAPLTASLRAIEGNTESPTVDIRR